MPLPAFAIPVLHRLQILARPMSIGVRGALFDEAGRILLVRHTYVPGWYMPGGGVDPGETAVEALAREFREETAVELTEAPRLVSVHFNAAKARRDHVLFYACGAHRVLGIRAPDSEIAETGFFAPGDLPEDTTAATRRRLAELAGEAPASPHW
ncbi:NUDIX domain-containing protein [Aurantimonas sp. Leaf443]|uniref:NUDIX domain-containing protein n=1 Tax=Aurantimonas sp. Leaf443 TaxID=1736378 RepID=UPI000A428D07|nr:NUDIX domain-containing protein [Aurantimonas sp. Leaf443]